MPRRFYLVILTVLAIAVAAAGVYLRQRAIRTAAAVADCPTPALPPPPTTPPPKLPGFALEAGCGTTPTTPAPAAAKAPR